MNPEHCKKAFILIAVSLLERVKVPSKLEQYEKAKSSIDVPESRIVNEPLIFEQYENAFSGMAVTLSEIVNVPLKL